MSEETRHLTPDASPDHARGSGWLSWLYNTMESVGGASLRGIIRARAGEASANHSTPKTRDDTHAGGAGSGAIMYGDITV